MDEENIKREVSSFIHIKYKLYILQNMKQVI